MHVLSALCRKRYLKNVIALLLVVVLCATAVVPQSHAAIALPIPIVAFIVLVLGSVGITFGYPDADAAVMGITKLVNDFLEDVPSVTLEDLVPSVAINAFLLNGVVQVAKNHVWNMFIDWLKENFANTPETNQGIYISVGSLVFTTPASTLPVSTEMMNEWIPAGIVGTLYSSYPATYYMTDANGNEWAYISDENGLTNQTKNGEYVKNGWFHPPVGIDVVSTFGVRKVSGKLYLVRAFYDRGTGMVYFAKGTAIQSNFIEWHMELTGLIDDITLSSLTIPQDTLTIPGETAEEPYAYVPSIPSIWNPANPAGYPDAVLSGVGTGAISVPNIQVGEGDITIPGGEEGGETDKKKINWQPLANALAGIGAVFPFCIPFNIVSMIQEFNAPAKALPPIDVNIAPFLGGNAGRIQIDLIGTEFNVVRNIFRTGVFLLFVVGLASVTGRFIKW